MKQSLFAICCSLFLCACGNNTTAKTPPPEYVFQKITTNFGYTAWKDDKQAAMNRVQERFDYSSKNACHGVGYGWAFMNIVDPGTEDCEVNPEKGLTRCRRVDVTLECGRIKPGTVGMGMIPFTQ